MSASSRRRAWVAFSVSLAVHAALGVALALTPVRALPGPAPAAGPPAVAVVEEESEDEGTSFLVARPEPTTSRPQPAANASPQPVGVTTAPEMIVPTAQVGAPAAGNPVGPTVAVAPTPAGHGQGVGSGPMGGAPFFEVGPQVRSVVYVIDRSSSMGFNGLLAAAARELRASLGRLPPDARFQIVVYHDRPELLLPGPRELLPATPENRDAVAARLDAVRAEGGTEHLPALRLALSLGPEVIFFLTDADDLKDADRREVTRLNRGRAVIHTVELTGANRGRPDMPLQVLARENRGRYVAVEPGDRPQ